MIRLIAADLDGTLLRSDGTISGRTRAVLKRSVAAGLLVVLVTARPPRKVRLIAREAGLVGLAICGNGALVYDLTTDTIVSQTPLEAAVALDLVATLRATVPGICFATEVGLQYGQEPDYARYSPHAEDTEPSLADASILCANGVTKLIALHPTLPLEALLHLVRGQVGAAGVVTHSGAPFIEIAAPGVTKARALATLGAAHGLGPEAVIAFGDMPNDLPLLTWSGHGVAVANAHPEVLALADEVTLSNDEDGVAVVLERLLAKLPVA